MNRLTELAFQRIEKKTYKRIILPLINQMMFSKIVGPGHILINRTDAIGDVVLALPVCGLIKKYYPHCKITFLGRTYTERVALTSIHVDDFINRDDWNAMSEGEISASLTARNIDTVIHLLPAPEVLEACKRAKIKMRIGILSKLTYWKNCNRLVAVSRRKSLLNEAQLNIKLLAPLGIKESLSRNDVPSFYGFSKIEPLRDDLKMLLETNKLNIILHPLSNKNAKEWGLHNFSALLKLIDKKRFHIFITGSENEKTVLSEWIAKHADDVTDLTGQLEMSQLISFIKSCDGMIASSTGPLHLAAASGINVLGLYENRWIKRGERWGPIGIRASYLQCVNDDMDTITPEAVKEHIDLWKKV